MYKILKVKNLIISPGKPAVCVPIVGYNEHEIISEIRKIKGVNSDMAEWRADYYQGLKDPHALKSLLEDIMTELKGMPFIFTIRTKQEGGKAELTPEEYFTINEIVCESKTADFVDIEIRNGEEKIKDFILKAEKNKVKVIVSKHDFEKTPLQTEIVADLISMQRAGAHIAKMAVMPKSKKDLLALLSATEEMYSNYAKIPIVTMSMDKTGFASRILGEIFGSAITFGTVDKSSAPGQINVEDLNSMLELIHKSVKKDSNNIMMIGFMGTGKTTVSNELSKLTSMNMVDTDHFIENKMGMKIPDIFKEYGEDYFRDLETEAIIEILSKENQIVSCGGGIVLRDENIRYMKERGKIVLLTASPGAILQRVQQENNRPLISNNMSEEDIIRLLEKRSDKYYAATDFVIDTTDKTVDKICNEIVSKLL